MDCFGNGELNRTVCLDLSRGAMISFEKFQRQLLEASRNAFIEKPMSAATEQAFLAAPRHLFVKRYCLWASPECHAVDETNLQQHLPTLYHNRPLILFRDDDENVPTTISQPSFVLSMLDMLQLEPGHQIFELGTGSGWNATLMGQLVGPTGHVYSLEIIPELARTAVDTFVALGIENVSIVEADGGESYTPGAPYDRAIFTAGTYDLPPTSISRLRRMACC